MKAIQVTCPNCGARLRADSMSTVVTCEYCGVASTIQRRTRILERVMPPTADVASAQQAMRYAVQAHSSAWRVGVVLLALVLPLVGVAIAIWVTVKNVTRTAVHVPRGAMQSPNVHGKTPSPSDRAPSWQGTDSVLVADVDGNGTYELVGRGRQVNAGDVIRVIALDLANGAIVWQSEPIGTYTDTYRGPLSIAGDLVVHASQNGEVQAIALRDGKRRWRTRLDERVRAFCAGDHDTVIAVGADDMLRTLSRADGTPIGDAKPVPGKGKPTWDKPAPCALLPTDDETPFERSQEAQRRHGSRNDRPGLSVAAVIDAPGGDKVLAAARKGGTGVTTIVVVDAKGHERWRATAAADALGAEGPPRHVVAGDRDVCIIYYSTQYRIACFALADGKRRWDIEAPLAQEGLLIVGRSLVVTTHRDLRVHDLDTGALRWSMD